MLILNKYLFSNAYFNLFVDCVGWTTESLLNWGQFLKLALAGMVMICIEWWSFELGAFLTGKVSEPMIRMWVMKELIANWKPFCLVQCVSTRMSLQGQVAMVRKSQGKTKRNFVSSLVV